MCVLEVVHVFTKLKKSSKNKYFIKLSVKLMTLKKPKTKKTC